MIGAIVLAAALGALPPVPQPTPVAPVTAASAGRRAYIERCASCHGVDLRGGVDAPSIRGVGAADVDFMVGTGRMPAAVPWVEPAHHTPRLSQTEIDAIVAYVVSVAPGGPPIPIVAANGDAMHGHALYRENCMHCHGVDAGGAAVGNNEWAPPLDRATVTNVAEAVRVGPGEMPAFSDVQIDQRDLDDLVTFFSQRRAQSGSHGLPVSGGNPVPEGLLGWIAAGLLALAGYVFSATSSGKDR